MVAQEWKTCHTGSSQGPTLPLSPACDKQSVSSGKENGSLSLATADGLILLKFAYYFADTFYNLLWVVEHATAQVYVTLFPPFVWL